LEVGDQEFSFSENLPDVRKSNSNPPGIP
jgi:hypothetical protein